jgi:uncharacterized membrane protein YphA (DoxX/SURF4 family)
MRTAWPGIGLAGRLAAAAIWLVAGIAKIVGLQHFDAQVSQYDVLPHTLVAPFAYTLPFVETAVGLYLLVGLLVRPAALLGCVLLVVFVAAQAQAWARGLSLDCGCFGTLAREQVGAGTILRDIALGLPSVAMAVWPSRLLSLEQSLGSPPRGGHPPLTVREPSSVLARERRPLQGGVE